MMFYNRLLIWGIKQAKADIGVMIKEYVNMTDSKFVYRRMNQFFQMVFFERQFVNI